MMKEYVAFLRGINVSGKNKIAMAELKALFISMGIAGVSTVLNSGNVLFSSESADGNEIGVRVSDKIREMFGYEVPVYVAERDRLRVILRHAPKWWNTGDRRYYHNLVFILTDDSPDDICRLVGAPSEGKEFIRPFDEVIFWSYDLSCYQKCNWWKMTAARGIAERLTIRTGNTVKRVCR